MFKSHYNEKNVKLLEIAGYCCRKIWDKHLFKCMFCIYMLWITYHFIDKNDTCVLKTLYLHLSITVSNACHNTHIHSSINFYVTI